MDYHEIRGLLVNSVSLTEDQAWNILLEWQENRELFNSFLKEDKEVVPLFAYQEYSPETETHLFVKTEYHAFSPAIAKKFFALEDDDIANAFIGLLTEYLINTKKVFAFPYLETDCIRHFSAEFLNELILNMYFVFDMSEDIHGLIYNALFEKISEYNESAIILAVNSFNQSGWLKAADKQLEDRIVHYTLSNHAFPSSEDEQVYFRKTFIRYLHETSEKTNEILTNIWFENAARNN